MNKEPDVLFIGDSLIERLQHSIVWSEFFEPLHCLNFGIGGDTTQNVLWRLENGEIDNIKPKVKFCMFSYLTQKQGIIRVLIKSMYIWSLQVSLHAYGCSWLAPVQIMGDSPGKFWDTEWLVVYSRSFSIEPERVVYDIEEGFWLL